MPETGLAQVHNFFTKYSDQVLTFNLNLEGRVQTVHFLREIVVDTEGLIDYQKLLQRMSELPGMVAFYGSLKDRAAAELAEAEEGFSMWQAEVTSVIQERKIEEMADKKMAAGLKKAPTMAELKGAVMIEHRLIWEEKTHNIKMLKEKLSILSRVLQGLEHSISLIQSQNKLLMLLWDKGVEEVRAKLPVNRG